MQFVIFAYDGTDEGAFERRMSVRPRHLENMAKVKEMGTVICAGGLLNEEGRMIGSMLVLDLPSRAELDKYLAGEPYIEAKVWKDVKIENFNTVLLNNEKFAK